MSPLEPRARLEKSRCAWALRGSAAYMMVENWSVVCDPPRTPPSELRDKKTSAAVATGGEEDRVMLRVFGLNPLKNAVQKRPNLRAMRSGPQSLSNTRSAPVARTQLQASYPKQHRSIRIVVRARVQLVTFVRGHGTLPTPYRACLSPRERGGRNMPFSRLLSQFSACSTAGDCAWRGAHRPRGACARRAPGAWQAAAPRFEGRPGSTSE